MALLFSFIAGWSLRPILEKQEEGVPLVKSALSEEPVVLVTIDYGSGTIEEMPEIPYMDGDSVLTVLGVLEETGLVTLSMADASVSLTAVTIALSNLADSPDAPGWHYWVNDVYGTMNPDAYLVQPGDHIHLTFTSELP